MIDTYIASAYAKLIIKYHELNFNKLSDNIEFSNDPNNQVLISSIQPYLRNYVQVVYSPSLSWKIAKYIFEHNNEMFTYSVSHSETLKEANKLTGNYLKLITNIVDFHAVHNKDQSIEVHAKLKTHHSHEYLFLFEIVVAVGFLNLVSILNINLEQIGHEQSFERTLNALKAQIKNVEIDFIPGKISYKYDKETLLAVNPDSEPKLKEMLVRELEVKFTKIPKEDDWKDKISSYLRDNIEKNTTLDDLSYFFNKSRRTMFRIIQNEGVTYKALHDEVRRDVSISLVKSDMPLKQVAKLGGFSSLSTFTSNFKKWFGESPASYRKKRINEKT